MKTKTLLILLLLISANICIGQQDTLASKKFILGVNISSTLDGESGFGYYTNFTIENGQNFFSIGPAFGSTKRLIGERDGIHSYYGNIALTGFDVVYQISPNPKRKIFQPYFQNELAFHYYVDNNTTQEIITDHGNEYFTTSIPYKSHQSVIGDFIGWGFKVKFLKNFCVSQSIGIGIEYYSTIQDFGDINYNRNDHYFYPDLKLKMGVGYKFDYKLQSSPAVSFAQIDSFASKKTILGLNISVMPSYEWEGLDYSANFTIEKGKNFLAAGPIIGMKLKLINDYEDNVSGQYGLTGFHIVYQRKVKLKEKRFNFYFQNEFMYHYYTDEGIYYAIWSSSNIETPKAYKSHATDVEDYIGYGCKIIFLKNFYFDQSFGLGIKYFSEVIDYGDAIFNKNFTENYPSATIKMGLGYTFTY